MFGLFVHVYTVLILYSFKVLTTTLNMNLGLLKSLQWTWARELRNFLVAL